MATPDNENQSQGSICPEAAFVTRISCSTYLLLQVPSRPAGDWGHHPSMRYKAGKEQGLQTTWWHTYPQPGCINGQPSHNITWTTRAQVQSLHWSSRE
jgi:hypothetical protein